MRNRNSAGSTSQAHFSRVPSANIQRSTFNRSHGHKTTFDSGKVVPIIVDKLYPADTIRLKIASIIRLATPLLPYMDNVYWDLHLFFCPSRLVWNNFQKYMGEQENPGDSIDYLTPALTLPVGGVEELSTYDYFGIPTKVQTDRVTDNMIARAYNLIWNTWFRDENLQDSVVVDKDDGPDSYADYKTVLPRGLRKDKFTSALPWTQKGPDVSVPIGITAPVHRVPNAPAWQAFQAGTQTPAPGVAATSVLTVAAGGDNPKIFANAGGAPLISLDPGTGGLAADLTDATAVTINTLREAFAAQGFYERDARGGTRFTELLLSHFGVRSPDARLQRPEYLGGGSGPINVSAIAQTSQTTDDSPQGNLAAFAMSSQSGVGCNYSVVEHGYLLGFISIRADMTYQQGLDKMWTINQRLREFWPSFANLGEEPILNSEIFLTGTDGDGLVFGYQERFYWMRYKESLVTGRMRSNATQSVDSWHLAWDFIDPPVLNDEFISMPPPIERVVTVQSEPQFVADFYFNYLHTRALPVYSVPALLDRF